MNIGLIRIARNHFALTLDDNEDLRPILWLYEHFLREAMDFPFDNPVREFWKDGGASTEVMCNTLSNGDKYVYFTNSLYASYYCGGLATRLEWRKTRSAFGRLKSYFRAIYDGNVTENLFDCMLEEFTLLCTCLCNKEALYDSYEMTKDM